MSPKKVEMITIFCNDIFFTPQFNLKSCNALNCKWFLKVFIVQHSHFVIANNVTLFSLKWKIKKAAFIHTQQIAITEQVRKFTTASGELYYQLPITSLANSGVKKNDQTHKKKKESAYF